MKKLICISLLAFALTACQKADNHTEPAQTDSQTQPLMQNHEHDNHHDHDDHDSDEHEHDDEHDDKDTHEHHAHNHDHDDDKYLCQNKIVKVGIHEHEGETEAHAVIDDIEYDFYPDTATPKQFVSQDGVGGSPMLMVLGEDRASFYEYKDNQKGKLIFDCQEQGS